MKTYFDQDWKNWIKTNVDAGQDKNGIFKILLDEGYGYDAIKHEMGYEPSVPIERLVNPFAATTQQKMTAESNHGAKLDRNQLFLPNSVRLDSNKIELYLLKNFLNAEECQSIIELINRQKQPSGLSSHEPDQYFRTSSTCYLGQMNDDFMHEIDQRICNIIGIDRSYSETIQGQYYEIGQEFKAHTDFFEAHEMRSHAAQMGQRTYTFMIYLNTVEEGGETEFSLLGEKIQPLQGMAVIWNSLNPDGSTNENTLHHALPVKKGYKAIITKWFRSRSNQSPAPSMPIKEANEYVPNFTQTGILKQRFPAAIFKQITDFYQENKTRDQDEFVEGGFIYNEQKGAKSSSLVDLSSELRKVIHDVMKPLMEKWCGEALEPTYVYGIRVYKDKAVLKSHRDRLETHVISAIINVDQDVNEDWPLVIEDNYYRQHHVVLKPGEMVFYEGARLKHGRPIALNGKSFANIFCHFKPVSYSPRTL